jgi:hypothetical protein
MGMDLTIPGICFLTSSVQLNFDTDGCVTHFEPANSRGIDADHILVLARLQVQQHRMTEIPAISLFDGIPVPDNLAVPEIYDGTQKLHGKRVLILMLNGWGDMILIQPAIRALYLMAASTGSPPRITLGCNWINNFPYPDAGYVDGVVPNILTLKQLCSFDILVNLLPVNHQRTAARSMRDLCLEILNLGPEWGGNDPPSMKPDPARVSRIRPALDMIRRETGKKLLCVNWRSRVPHKNAPATLFFQVADRLKDAYQALVFKDEGASKIMQKEIDPPDSRFPRHGRGPVSGRRLCVRGHGSCSCRGSDGDPRGRDLRTIPPGDPCCRLSLRCPGQGPLPGEDMPGTVSGNASGVRRDRICPRYRQSLFRGD